jgi:hypothetical protein
MVPLNVTLTFCSAVPDPYRPLKVTAEGVAFNPKLLFPTLRFTGKGTVPTGVVTKTVPV